MKSGQLEHAVGEGGDCRLAVGRAGRGLPQKVASSSSRNNRGGAGGGGILLMMMVHGHGAILKIIGLQMDRRFIDWRGRTAQQPGAA